MDSKTKLKAIVEEYNALSDGSSVELSDVAKGDFAWERSSHGNLHTHMQSFFVVHKWLSKFV